MVERVWTWRKDRSATLEVVIMIKNFGTWKVLKQISVSNTGQVQTENCEQASSGPERL